MCRCTCGHVTFSGGIRNLIVFGDISFKIQCTRLVLIGYKNVTGDIQKYVKIIKKNGFCNVKFCFGIALSKTGRPSSTHALLSFSLKKIVSVIVRSVVVFCRRTDPKFKTNLTTSFVKLS